MVCNKKPYVVFFDGCDREILRISLEGLMLDEIQNTIGLLAYERGIPENDISFAEVLR